MDATSEPRRGPGRFEISVLRSRGGRSSGVSEWPWHDQNLVSRLLHELCAPLWACSPREQHPPKPGLSWAVGCGLTAAAGTLGRWASPGGRADLVPRRQVWPGFKHRRPRTCPLVSVWPWQVLSISGPRLLIHKTACKVGCPTSVQVPGGTSHGEVGPRASDAFCSS